MGTAKKSTATVESRWYLRKVRRLTHAVGEADGGLFRNMACDPSNVLVCTRFVAIDLSCIAELIAKSCQPTPADPSL